MHDALRTTGQALLALGMAAALTSAAACRPPAPETEGGISGQGGTGSSGGTGGEGGPASTGGTGGMVSTGGTGGMVSTGGTGGMVSTGGTGGTRVPIDRSNEPWLEDDAPWKLLPPPELWNDECWGYEGIASKLQFPALEWESCGLGCERADVVQGYGFAIYASLATSQQTGHEVAHLQMTNAIHRETYALGLTRVIDLETGRTVAAIKTVPSRGSGKSHCSMYRPSVAYYWSAMRIMYSGSSEEIYHIAGIPNLNSGVWTWVPPIPDAPAPVCQFGVTEDGGGHVLKACPKEVVGILTSDSNVWTTIWEPGPGWFPEAADGMGDLFVWAESGWAGPSTRVQGWKDDGQGTRTIIPKIDGYTCKIDLSATRLAGLMFEGADCQWVQPGARIWVASRDAGGAVSTDVKVSPVLSEETLYGSKVASAGQHVAVYVGRDYTGGNLPIEDQMKLIVGRIPDWSMRVIPAPPPASDLFEKIGVKQITMTSDYLYVAYAPYVPGMYTDHIDSVYRYDLSKFDEIGLPFTGTFDPP